MNGKGSKDRVKNYRAFKDNFETIDWGHGAAIGGDLMEHPIEQTVRMTPKIIQNAVRITDRGRITYLRSSHRHDFQQYTFNDGSTIAVDGGCEYIRRAGSPKGLGNSVEVVEWCLTEDSPMVDMADKLLWGVTTKPGEHEVKPLIELTTKHLKAILRTQPIDDTYTKVINYILDLRK